MKSYIQNKKILKKRKSHFQLLEVMVAIFLIMVCAVPAFKILTQVYQEQAAVVRINQRDHLVHLIHAKIIEQLYKRAISIDEIIEGMHAKFSDPFLQSELDRLKYEASYELSVIEPRTEKGKEKANEYLGKMIIEMKDIALPEKNQKKEMRYDYLFYFARIDRNKKGAVQNETPPPVPEKIEQADKKPVKKNKKNSPIENE